MSALARLQGIFTAARASAASFVAGRVRRAGEFDIARLASTLTPQATKQDVYTWEIPTIRSARDDQLKGKFFYPARLAEAMRTDDALATAYRYRIAPQDSISTILQPATGAASSGPHTADTVAAEASSGVHIQDGALNDISGCLANHGIAIGYNSRAAREDGSRIDLEFRSWPIEQVRWDATRQLLVTRVDGLSDEEAARARAVLRQSVSAYTEIPIVHGDGRWVVFQKHAIDPWKQDAAILPGGLVWARHAFAARDWAQGSASHGSAKIVGELAEGVSLTDAEGSLTVEAAAFLSMLQAMVSGNAAYGIRPFGAKTEFVSNTSSAWQVWSALIENAERAAARVYLGTDGILGAKGGAPGVDIQALFGVAVTIVSSDLNCIMRGLHSGTYQPWAAINFGDSRLAPIRAYQIPDLDEDAVRESFAKRNNALFVDLKSAKDAGCIVDQPYVDALSGLHGVPAPKLAVGAALRKEGYYGYEIESGGVLIDEWRASVGLKPITNGTGAMTPLQVKAMFQDGASPGVAIPSAALGDAVTAPANGGTEIDPDGDGEPGEPPTDEAAAELATRMTEEQVPACEHGAKNRCRLCGVERVRKFHKDDEGNVVWDIAWRPIQQQP